MRRAAPEVEWVALHDAVLRRDRWVFHAMKPALLDRRLEAADTAVFLDLPRRACMLGILRRRLRYGRDTVAHLGVAPRLDRALLRWVWRFRSVQRPAVLACLAPTTTVIVLRSRRDVRAFLSGLAVTT